MEIRNKTYTEWFKSVRKSLKMKYNNFIIETRGVRSNPEPIQGCECTHPSAM